MAKSKTVHQRLDDIEKKLNQVLKNQKKLQKLENESISLEHNVEKLENKELSNEEKYGSELDDIISMEEEIKKSVSKNPLKKITYRDFAKAMVGAFVGVVGHFAFIKGTHFAHSLDIFKSTVLLIVAFLIGLLILYYSGFRKVKKIKFLSFIPLRAVVIFVAAIAVIEIVLLLFGFITFETSFIEIYKMTATISILAMLGAGTADLIGEN